VKDSIRRIHRVQTGPVCALHRQPEGSMFGLLLIPFLILVLIGTIPTWPHSRNWGYYPSGGLGLVLVTVVILTLQGCI